MIHISFEGGDLGRALQESIQQFVQEKAEAIAQEHYHALQHHRHSVHTHGLHTHEMQGHWVQGSEHRSLAETVVMKPVLSSNLESVGYDVLEETLHIRFRSGRTIYVYSRVPAQTYRDLMRAPSKGHYFDAYIKNRYSFTKR